MAIRTLARMANKGDERVTAQAARMGGQHGTPQYNMLSHKKCPTKMMMMMMMMMAMQGRRDKLTKKLTARIRDRTII